MKIIIRTLKQVVKKMEKIDAENENAERSYLLKLSLQVFITDIQKYESLYMHSFSFLVSTNF